MSAQCHRVTLPLVTGQRLWMHRERHAYCDRPGADARWSHGPDADAQPPRRSPRSPWTRPAPGTDRGFLAELEGQPAFGHVTPNWFASVMGTGIVANAAATLPVHVPGLLDAARVVWVLDLLLLVVVTAATVVHWVRHPDRARAHLADPVMSHFYGAPAMALMTVGAGAMLVGQPGRRRRTPRSPSTPCSGPPGTLLGLWTAVAVPYRAFTDHDVKPDSAFGGWLMPVVPPMVSAATGTLLLPHLPAGQARRPRCWSPATRCSGSP